MAVIRETIQPNLPFDNGGLSNRSFTAISWRFHREIEKRAKDKLSGQIRRITTKSLKEAAKEVIGVQIPRMDPIGLDVQVISVIGLVAKISLVLPCSGEANLVGTTTSQLIENLRLERFTQGCPGHLVTQIPLSREPVTIEINKGHDGRGKQVLVTQEEAESSRDRLGNDQSQIVVSSK